MDSKYFITNNVDFTHCLTDLQMKIPTLLDCTIKRPKKFYKRDAKKFIIFVMKSSFQYNFKKRTKTRNKLSFFSCNVVVLIFFIKHLELRKQLNANSIVRKENFANWATLKKKENINPMKFLWLPLCFNYQFYLKFWDPIDTFPKRRAIPVNFKVTVGHCTNKIRR